MASGLVELYWRIVHLEEKLEGVEDEVKAFRKEFGQSQRGMSRGEKLALASVAVTIIMAIIATIALVQTAP